METDKSEYYLGSSLGHIENCSNCHRFRRIQFVLTNVITGEASLCSSECLIDFVNRTLFPKLEYWNQCEWEIKPTKRDKRNSERLRTD